MFEFPLPEVAVLPIAQDADQQPLSTEAVDIFPPPPPR